MREKHFADHGDAVARQKFFIDTEFIESGCLWPIELLSIGIVCEDGRQFYAEVDSANLSHANDWVKANVLTHLSGPKMARNMLARAVRKFVGNSKPEFWGYYADYDWVVFCQIFGAMIDLPKGWPMYCRDLKQLCVDCGDPKLPKQEAVEHNALNDARWNKQVYDFLITRRTEAYQAGSADRWVSVEEKLPAERDEAGYSGLHLVFSHNDQHVTRYDHVAKSWAGVHDVTHWMPLPAAPPKKEDCNE